MHSVNFYEKKNVQIMRQLITTYGLLYVSPDQASAVNLGGVSVQEALGVYLNCARTLAKSLKTAGLDFVLLTNNSDALSDIGNVYLEDLEIREIAFDTIVPIGIRFYSAHYKIDVFKYLSQIESGYSIFLDLDVICIGRVPEYVRECARVNMPMIYDISNQIIGGRGLDYLTEDLEKFISTDKIMWCGGEFVAGNSVFFKELSSEIEQIYPHYLANIDKLNHVGDEVLLTLSVMSLLNKGKQIKNASEEFSIVRYWSAGAKHRQVDVRNCIDAFILHLPADKLFLANLDIGVRGVDYVRREVLTHLNSADLVIKRTIRSVLRVFKFRIKN